MTAIVGIINKKGVAIAADSASTLKKKIINSGNKMLRLSNGIDAAVMIVNNSSLAQIPWEVIIRWYRKESGETKYDSLQDCIGSFIEFVNNKVLSRDDIPDERCLFDEEVTTNLVFAGYGVKDVMPTMCELYIYGIDHRKLMSKPEKGYRLSSSDHEATIYAQGQPEIIKSYIHGVIDGHIDRLIEGHIKIFRDAAADLPYEYLPTENALSFDHDALPNIKINLESVINQCKKESEEEWLNAVKNYSIQEMASLAENFIKATELRKKIMNEEEQVGGLIDLAIITKNDGFQWLNRKSWYDPSRGGQYGKFGI